MKTKIFLIFFVVFSIIVFANGIFEEILPVFDSYVQENMEKWYIPGMAVGVIKDGELIFKKGYGVKDLETGEPVTPETIFQIGSTSKAFTSFLVGQLVDQGIINWKDRVVEHFPEFQMYDSWVTSNFLIEDLMAQHSGLPPYSGDLGSILGFSRDEIIEKMRLIPLANTFRTDFAYQNNLFLVAAKIVEIYSGMTWEENVDNKILDVLEMNDSSNTPDDYMKTGNYATTYAFDNREVTKLEFDGNLFKFPYVYGPAGGINSNIIDMSKWITLQMNKGKYKWNELLSEIQYNFLHRPATLIGLDDSKAMFYCQGWIYDQRKDYKVFWHNGGTIGCKTMVAYLPDDNLGIVVLSNLVTELPDSLAYVLFDLYKGLELTDYSAQHLQAIEAYYNREIEEPEIVQTDSLPLENYTGTYFNDYFEEISVYVEDESLKMIIVDKDITFDLFHLNRDDFYVDDSDLLEVNGTVVAFSIDEYGFAESLTFKGDLASPGLKTLNRIK